MQLVHEKLTSENIERARQNPELEKLLESEIKLTTTNPELLERLFKADAYPIEQFYLSSPDDEASLRVKCDYKPAGVEYSTALKGRGNENDEVLERGEVEESISDESFAYYQSLDLPVVQKLRTKVMEGVTVDFYDDPVEPIIVEVEHSDPEVRASLLDMMQRMTENSLVNRSNDPALTNEAIAYRAYARSGKTEHLKKKPETLDAFSERVLSEMVAQYVSGKSRVITGLTGMSGSGKTTVTRALQERIVELYGEEFKPVVISTDDYHFGKTHLEAAYGAPYTEWDDAKTYDTEQLANDLLALSENLPIAGRHFSFETEEPAFEGEVTSSPFIIIEGLYAGSNDLDEVRDLHFTLPTGIATAINRDIRRLVIDNRANRAFPTPQSRLKYQIEVALPKYLEQQAPRRKAFSASVRPMADRAFMLGALSK